MAQLAKTTDLNAVVIDLKDATGSVTFNAGEPRVRAYRAGRRNIHDLGALVEKLHEAGLYVIARIVVFNDTKLAEAEPRFAVHSRAAMGRLGGRSAQTLWRDHRGQAWADPGAEPVWSYIAAIARDALSRGVDELNFDYIRFPSDGALRDMDFPSGSGARRRAVLRSFFAYLRRELKDARISADLFGLATVNHDDLGIGQVIEDALEQFDYVCPMVYPSHYARGFLGYPNPAVQPRRVVGHSMRMALERLRKLQAQGRARARLRPWLQDFNLGAVYDESMVAAQIEAAREALGETYCGFLLWNPGNRYTTAVFRGAGTQAAAAGAAP